MTRINDLYENITNKIIADLEKGDLTWRKPWSGGNLATLPLRGCGIPYSGINTIVLWSKAFDKGYVSPYWMTYRQAKDMKAHVRKGEKSTTVIYADKMVKEETAPDGSIEKKAIPFMKCYSVFNAVQIEGLPESFYAHPEPSEGNSEERVQELERFFKETNADIFTGVRAAYHTTKDRIEMPPFECFEDARSYYATLAHELTHWTRHRSRLAREFNRKAKGDAGYAMEELVAELGACFLAAELGIEPVPHENHAAYIETWLSVLKNDTRFIFTAAAHAQRAVAFIKELQAEPGAASSKFASPKTATRKVPPVLAPNTPPPAPSKPPAPKPPGFL